MGSHDKAADLIVTGAAVYTVDAARRWAEAIAIKDGRIIAVGTRWDVMAAAGPATEIVQLEGRMVLPGFQDAHVHALFGGLNRLQCDLHDAGNQQNHVDAVAAYAKSHPEAEWILGGGWAMDAFPGGTPHRALLDAIVPDRPVYLQNRDVHGAWVNTKALELAGIDASTPDPSGGRIERDVGGEPSGTLHEHAMDLVAVHTPAPTTDDREEALALGQTYLHSLGITAWQDPWITEAELATYSALDARGELTGHVSLDLLWERDGDETQIETLIEQRERFTQGRVRAGGVKIFQDGVAENFTAAMIDPYLDGSGRPTGNSGISMVEPAALNHYVGLLDASGFQVHFHAIGDRAVRESLDALEAAQSANGTRDARHHICHLQVVHPADIARFRTLGVVANCQPLWACEDPQMRDLTIPFLGPERSTRQYPFASLRRSGATLAFGSDWSVSTPDPLLQIEVAVNRVPADDRAAEPFLPNECLDLPAALEAFTIGSAYVNRREGDSGSIETGKAADLVVLDRNLFDGDGPSGEAKVLATLVDGAPVYVHPSLDW
ncbi:MAG: amidohydrolase [Actinomycetota bacterium]|nr:amidohydrolase [Actinomycetota bacterium]